MSARILRSTTAVAALLFAMFTPIHASAQCSTCGVPSVAYYQPTAYTAYSPVVYQSYYSGWYPGYWLDQARVRLWGAPSTYAVSYPSTYYASYALAYYTAAYRPAYAAGYVTSYAPVSSCSTCSTCTACYSPCDTCATVQQVALRPVCATACAPSCGCDICSGCATCGTTVVSQAGCATCGNGATVSPDTFEPQINAAPTLPAESSVPAERPPVQTEKPVTNGNQQEVEPEPGNGEAGATTSGASYFEAPKLFDPNDRAAQRHIAPVRTAVYEKPVSYRTVSAQRITSEQAAQDAVGWTSAAN